MSSHACSIKNPLISFTVLSHRKILLLIPDKATQHSRIPGECVFLLPRRAVGLGAPQTIVDVPQRNNSVHAGCSCGHLGAISPWSTFLHRFHVCNFHTGILARVVDNAFINYSHRSSRTFRVFFIFRNYFLPFLFSFTMVIKRFRELRGESTFGDRPASSMSK